jgi:hypothetical protein
VRVPRCRPLRTAGRRGDTGGRPRPDGGGDAHHAGGRVLRGTAAVDAVETAGDYVARGDDHVGDFLDGTAGVDAVRDGYAASVVGRHRAAAAQSATDRVLGRVWRRT